MPRTKKQTDYEVPVAEKGSLWYFVTITGLTPYMQHRMDTKKLKEWETARGKIIERDGVNKDESLKADFHSYIEFPNGNKQEGVRYYIPTVQIKQSLVGGGGYVKSKVGNARRSMKNVVAAMFFVYSPFSENRERIYINHWDEIDIRTALNHASKARIVTYRPKWNRWEISFYLRVHNDTVTDEEVASILYHAGSYQGIGSYRPEHQGHFGTFKVTKLTRLAEAPEGIVTV